MTLDLDELATAPPLRAPWVLILADHPGARPDGQCPDRRRTACSDRTPPNPGRSAVAMPPTACPPGTVLESGDIATIAGTGAWGVSGDGGPATAAPVDAASGRRSTRRGPSTLSDVALGRHPSDRHRWHHLDPRQSRCVGNADTVAAAHGVRCCREPVHRRRRRSWQRDPNGTLTSVAGNRRRAVRSGTGARRSRPASTPRVWPSGRAVTCISMTIPSGEPSIPPGVIHPFAGTGIPGFSGDGGPAGSAHLRRTGPWRAGGRPAGQCLPSATT